MLYGNPAHLLDVANYVKVAWDSVSEASISNAFKKAELTSKELGVEDECNETDIEDEVMKAS
jgi:hypothetical protein